MEIIPIDWSIDLPLNFETGETYIVKVHNDNGGWASLLITVKGYNESVEAWQVKVETLLDGSEGIMAAYYRSMGIE